MFKIPKQEYTAEFKELAVKQVKDGQGIGPVARELGLVEQTLRNWVDLPPVFRLPRDEFHATSFSWGCTLNQSFRCCLGDL